MNNPWQRFGVLTQQSSANVVVRAGAGAGKTHALVYHYLLALLGLETPASKPLQPGRIVAVTFTENAACEMRERIASTILALLQQRCDNPLQQQLEYRAKQLRVAMPAAATLEQLWEAVQQAPICTFHSLCASLLRRYGEAVGVQPHFTLLDAFEQKQQLQRSCLSVLLPALQQENAALYQLVARLGIQDVAGRNGLISLFCALYQQMQEHGLQPQHAPLACTATAQQRQHCIDNVQQTLQQLQQQCANDTQPSVRQLQEAWDTLHGVVMGDAAQLHTRQSEIGLAFASCMTKLSAWGRSHAVRACKSALQQLGNWLCNAVVLPQQLAVRDALQQLHKHSLAHKLQAQTLGFADLLQLTVTLLRRHPDMRQRAQQRFDKLLVDECQDTNALQAELVVLLTQRRDSPMRPLLQEQSALAQLPLQPGMLFVVGDPKQSIYGFRGADVHLFEQLSDKIAQEVSGQQENLRVCRRCQGNIVEFVNLVAAATLPAGEDGVAFTPDDRLHVFRQAKHREQGQNNKPAQPPCGQSALWQVQLRDGQDANAAMHQVLALQLQHVLQQRTVTPADVAVLVRRQQMGQQIKQQLQRVGIPTYLVGGDPFFLRQEVADTVAALRLLLHPWDEWATLIVLRSAFVGLRDACLVKLLAGLPQWQRGLAWPHVVKANEAVVLDSHSRARIAAFERLLQQLRSQMHTKNLGVVAHTLLQQSGYGLSLASEQEGERRLHSLQQFLWQGYACTHNPFITVQHWWQLLQQAQQPSSHADDTVPHDAVRIMTIHQAKGLEFAVVVLADTLTTAAQETHDIVFDPDLGLAVGVRGQAIALCAAKSSSAVSQQLPLAIDAVRQRRRQRVHAELARVLYVAMTRARDRLYIMDAVSGKQNTHARVGSLQELLQRARQHDAAAFDRLMPTVPLQVGAQDRVAKQQRVAPIAKQPDNEPTAPAACQACAQEAVVPAHVGTLRLTPSQLARYCHNQNGQSEQQISVKPLPASHHTDPVRLGRLTHAVLAAVSFQLPQGGQLLDAQQIDCWLQAAVAAQGLHCDEHQARQAMQLARRTLLGPLGQMLSQATWFSFEHAIAYPIQDVVVQGYADLVLHSGDGVGIVDFKLSPQAAASASTRLQLYAYAQAFVQAQEPAHHIWVATHVLGSEACLQPLSYHRQAQEELQRAVKHACHTLQFD